MFGHDERLRLGQIKHLTGAMANARFRVEAHAAHRTGRRIMIDDFVGISDLSQGLALCPFCPPGFLPDRSRKLDTRAGFFSPSLDGGLPLFELFNPSRRSSSAIWALSAATSAMSSSRDGSASDSAFIESLNRSQIPLSRKFCTVVCGKKCSLTWPVTKTTPCKVGPLSHGRVGSELVFQAAVHVARAPGVRVRPSADAGV